MSADPTPIPQVVLRGQPGTITIAGVYTAAEIETFRKAWDRPRRQPKRSAFARMVRWVRQVTSR
jgi:hypothetical protein